MSTQGMAGASGFEEKHLISIMLYLNLNPVTKKMEIYDNISTNPRIPAKLDLLEASGLITQERDRNSGSVIIRLTDKGAEAAGKFAELDALLKRPIH